jgi:hypothetical protein
LIWRDSAIQTTFEGRFPMSALQSKLDDTLSRADDLLRERLRREKAALEAEDAERADEARAQARADAHRNREIGEIYDDAFRAFGVTTPEPADDERPRQYRRRLYERLRRKLPSSHDLAGVRADELPAGQAFVNFEAMLLDAAKAEGERPSVENLPDDGSLIARTRVDANTGTKFNEFFGRESFVKQMGMPGRRVLNIVNPRTGDVLYGRAYAKQPTFR